MRTLISQIGRMRVTAKSNNAKLTDGFTMVETLVTLTIMTVIITIVGVSFTSFHRSLGMVINVKQITDYLNGIAESAVLKNEVMEVTASDINRHVAQDKTVVTLNKPSLVFYQDGTCNGVIIIVTAKEDKIELNVNELTGKIEIVGNTGEMR